MKAVEHERFKGVYWIDQGGKKVLATKNIVPGFRSYDEVVRVIEGEEYRIWDPRRSKPAAAIMNGLKSFPIRPGTKILYLGIASGTTASHFSDIIGKNGIIYGVEVSQRVMRDLLPVSEARRNIVPILASARDVDSYVDIVEEVDVVYTDVAQRDEAEILIRNADLFLKKGGYAMIAVKASSIDVTAPPKKVYRMVQEKLVQSGYKPVQQVDLAPYDQKHAIILVKK